MSIKLVLKEISLIYEARGKLYYERPEKFNEYDMVTFSFAYLENQFGTRQFSEQKLLIFLLSVKKYISVFRVNFYARFLGLIDNSANFTTEDVNKYAEGLQFITNESVMGVAIQNEISNTRFYVPFIRAIQYLGKFSDTRMTREEYLELKKEIETLAENDPKNNNTNGIIDFDLFMDRILTKYRILINRTKVFVINAFAACDLDGNGVCSFDEFILLNRYFFFFC